jgi:hypothetical protein
VQRCFEDADFLLIYCASVFATFAFTVAFPVSLSTGIRRIMREGLHTDPNSLMVYGYFYSPFTKSRGLWFLVPHYSMGALVLSMMC